jgi:hypothetical protein
MTNIREAMPLLATNEGVWEGVYRYYNPAGELIDQHKSKLVCRFPASGEYPYHQTNYYTWDDGRTETRDFPAKYCDGRIWWDNDLIKGWAAEVPLDDKNRTTMLYWERKGEPGLYLYEMIQNSDDRQTRCRTWHWIRDGVLVQRTCIEEVRVSHSTEGY